MAYAVHDATPMSLPLGCRRWAIAEGYISAKAGLDSGIASYETACFLNTGDEEAHVQITVFFRDRDPVGPYEITVGARRTKHVCLNDLTDPEMIPRGIDYSSVIESDVPIVVQYTRLEAGKATNALFSTVPYACD